MKILVVDDESLSRLVVQAVVERLGHECVAAVDGEAGWRRFVDDEPDVLIADRLMPGIDGLELCRRVRADPRPGYTYIILVTVLGDREDVLRGMEAGADDYLVKPVDPFALESRLIAAERVTALHTELACYRAELAELARKDALTGLGNRRSLEEDLGTLHARSQRYGRSYCVAMCDVDRFKAFNDTYGHQAGDEALSAVARRISAAVRTGDGVYRYGGEELLLVLPEQNLESGLVAVERVRAVVEQLAIPHAAGPGGVLTLSAGIAAYRPGDETTPGKLLKQADGALYQAKSAGRNRVCQGQAPVRGGE
ncbi:MAG TPA: diguanylate cyclase [Actinomycetes bacterium]|nr:diguanylate cyclase [Actinomycetes bacterium]